MEAVQLRLRDMIGNAGGEVPTRQKWPKNLDPEKDDFYPKSDNVYPKNS